MKLFKYLTLSSTVLLIASAAAVAGSCGSKQTEKVAKSAPSCCPGEAVVEVAKASKDACGAVEVAKAKSKDCTTDVAKSDACGASKVADVAKAECEAKSACGATKVADASKDACSDKQACNDVVEVAQGTTATDACCTGDSVKEKKAKPTAKDA